MPVRLLICVSTYQQDLRWLETNILSCLTANNKTTEALKSGFLGQTGIPRLFLLWIVKYMTFVFVSCIKVNKLCVE